MSKIDMSKTSLLTEFFYYDSENLSSQIKLEIFFCYWKKISLKIEKLLKNLIYFHIRKCLEIKLSKN
jgi:hypothetical protein